MSIIPRLNLIKILNGECKEIMVWKREPNQFLNKGHVEGHSERITCPKCSERIRNVEFIAETIHVKPRFLFLISNIELHSITYHRSSYTVYNKALPYHLQRNLKFLDNLYYFYQTCQRYKKYSYLFYFALGFIFGLFF